MVLLLEPACEEHPPGHHPLAEHVGRMAVCVDDVEQLLSENERRSMCVLLSSVDVVQFVCELYQLHVPGWANATTSVKAGDPLQTAEAGKSCSAWP